MFDIFNEREVFFVSLSGKKQGIIRGEKREKEREKNREDNHHPDVEIKEEREGERGGNPPVERKKKLEKIQFLIH